MKRIGFRGRLFLILLSFALVPTLVLTFAWAATTWLALPLGVGAWDSTAESGAKVIEIARAQRLSRSDATAVTEHEQALKIVDAIPIPLPTNPRVVDVIC